MGTHYWVSLLYNKITIFAPKAPNTEQHRTVTISDYANTVLGQCSASHCWSHSYVIGQKTLFAGVLDPAVYIVALPRSSFCLSLTGHVATLSSTSVNQTITAPSLA